MPYGRRGAHVALDRPRSPARRSVRPDTGRGTGAEHAADQCVPVPGPDRVPRAPASSPPQYPGYIVPSLALFATYWAAAGVVLWVSPRSPRAAWLASLSIPLID